MSDNILKHCEPCNTVENSTVVDATTHCLICEESYCEKCSTSHRSQKATRGHDLTNIEKLFENTQQTSPSTVCEPCSEYGIRLTAVFRCLNCEESYCKNCARTHKSQKATRNHEFTDIEKENTRSVCEACSYNGIEDRPASALCKTCDEVFCIDCTKAHKSQKATRGHQMENHQDANKQPSEELETDQTSLTNANCCDVCKDKDKVLYDAFWFCFNCRQALCESCANDHKKTPKASNHLIIYSSEQTQGHQVLANSAANAGKSSIDSISDECRSRNERKGCYSCDTSNDDDDIAGFCLDCKAELCSACATEHGQSEDTQSHRLLINSHQQQNDPASFAEQLTESEDESSRRISASSITEENKGKHKRSGCDDCDISDDEKITSICLDCKTQLCSACVEIHLQSKDTHSHRLKSDVHKQQDDSITSEEQLIKSDDRTIKNVSGIRNLESAITGVTDLCQSCHGQSPVTAFCFDCLMTLCDECTVKHTEDEGKPLHTIMKRNNENLETNKGTDGKREEIISKQPEGESDISGGKPGKPVQVGALKVDRVTITWSAPKELFDFYCYQIRYKEDKSDANWQYYDEDKKQNTSLSVKNLKSHSRFLLQVRMVNNEKEGPYSEVSDPIETLPSAAEIVYRLSDEVADLGKQLKLRKFRLNENTAGRNSQLKTRKLILGDGNTHHQTEKTVLLLGASGTGKTTFVNGIINYLFGVTFADGFRFSIMAAEEDELLAGSTGIKGPAKTQWITCYSVNPVKGSKTDYRLTLIDTPGFGERGIERDDKIKQQLKELFSAVDEKGVLFVDAVCIFMRASESRLTVTQEYIYTTITSLFHRDIEENICSIVTFSDGKPPPVLSALKEAKLPYETFFPFNTTEIFSDNLQTSQTSLTKVFFDMNTSSFESFMNKLATLKTKSLSQSKEVLQKRQQIEETAEMLLTKVEFGLNKMEDCRSEIAALEKFKSQMTDNKDFKYKRKKHVQNLIPLEKGRHTTNCLHCNVTCHDNCSYANDEDKAKCIAMNTNGYCTVCEDRCYWDVHKNTPFIIEWLEVEEEGTYDEMMKKYQEASDEVVTHEAIVNKMKKELDDVEKEMLEIMNKIADCNNQLSKIALRANPLSVAEHIDIIIENEKWERKPGFQDRINNLEKLKKRSAVGEEFEQFQKSKEDIYK